MLRSESSPATPPLLAAAAKAFGFENTSFNHADIAAYLPPSLFDAIVGRLVLQFVPDPIAMIKRLYGMLRPGRILALQESAWKLWLTYTAHLPLHLSVTTAARDALQAGGASTEMGSNSTKASLLLACTLRSCVSSCRWEIAPSSGAYYRISLRL
jgi:trans-aconitate methyltransferase